MKQKVEKTVETKTDNTTRLVAEVADSKKTENIETAVMLESLNKKKKYDKKTRNCREYYVPKLIAWKNQVYKDRGFWDKIKSIWVSDRKAPEKN